MTSEETLQDLEDYLSMSRAVADPFADRIESLIADSRLLRELREKLPKCDQKECGSLATYMWHGADDWACDDHVPEGRKKCFELPWADVMRRMG